MNNTEGTGGIYRNDDLSDQGLWWYYEGDDFSGGWMSDFDSDKNGTWTTDPADPMHKIGEFLIYDGLWYNKDGENAGVWSYSEEDDQFDGKWRSWEGFAKGTWNFDVGSQTSGTWIFEDGSTHGTWTEDSNDPTLKHDNSPEC